jgi:predicted ATP-grasp superfamily ATP-dependent carboligase
MKEFGGGPQGTDKRPWLLVGLSVRPLAEAAAAHGHDVCAIDAFADRETLAACAGRVVKLPLDAGWRIDDSGLRHALREVRRCHAPAGFSGVTACGGFEGKPELLELLAASALLLGNDAARACAVRQPRHWFSLLDRIGAPYPDVRFTPPTPCRGWLVKSAGGSGGWHVRPWDGGGPLPTDTYFQRFEPGHPASALFVADGHSAHIIGWQWQILAPTADLPWRYGGVMTAPDMAPANRLRVADFVQAIVAETGLRGLCGLDFLIDGERIHVLELNPRPTASVALYPDRDLFAMHRDASFTALPSTVEARSADLGGTPVGEAVLYAPAPMVIPEDFSWPNWCRDVPAGTARVELGQPVCSVRASATSPTTVGANLVRKLHTLSTELKEHNPDESQPRERQFARRTACPIAAR